MAPNSNRVEFVKKYGRNCNFSCNLIKKLPLKNAKIYLEKGTFTLKNGSLEVLHVNLNFEVFHKYLKISGITILLSKRIKTLQLLKRHQHPLTSEV